MKMYMYKATGAATAVTVPLGMKPKFVRVLNLTDLTEHLLYPDDDETNDYGIAVAVSGAKTQAASAAAGVVVYAGTKDGSVSTSGIVTSQATGDSDGITIGASAVVNGDGDALLIFAGYDDDC